MTQCQLQNIDTIIFSFLLTIASNYEKMYQDYVFSYSMFKCFA